MSYAFGTLLFYQAKNAISPEYEHQRKKETGGIKKDWTGIRRMWRKVLILTC